MCFICHDDVEVEHLDWGSIGWIIRPQHVPDASQLVALDVTLQPGKGHDFHRHPDQEEMIFVRHGSVEQWLRDERQQLDAGDAVFIPQGEVHATFVADDAPEAVRLLVVLGPSHGPGGYEAVDVSTDEPWASLR